MKRKVKVKWVCEYGSFSLDYGVYYHDHDSNIIGNSYDECIIKLAKRIKRLIGKKQLLDYMNINGEIEIRKNRIVDKLPEITWESEKILKIIRKL